jgi:hypothetical protein
MEPKTLTHVLDRALGIEGSGHEFRVDGDHRLTLFLGEAGEGMEVGDVSSMTLHDDFLEVVTRQEGTYYLSYAPVQGICVRASKAKSGRTGFA